MTNSICDQDGVKSKVLIRTDSMTINKIGKEKERSLIHQSNIFLSCEILDSFTPNHNY